MSIVPYASIVTTVESPYGLCLFNNGYSAPMIRKQFEVSVTSVNQSEYLAGRRTVRPLRVTV